ncbi:MAG: ATP-binding protein [Methanomicrobiales archaeon]|nr:ATP-binding protein [Methanomicrobiales archaeon]
MIVLKTELRQIIIDQQSFLSRSDALISRDIDLHTLISSEEIVVLSGIRRCGKSTILFQLSDILSGHSLFINFDDIRFSDWSIENFQHIYEIIGELFGSKESVSLLLDEIQNIPGWERWVNNLYQYKVKTIITGSNASVLSSELGTYLTGRHKTVRVHPFSFKEYLLYHGIENVNPDFVTSPQKGEIVRYLQKYLIEGGFPAVVKSGDISLSEQYLTDIIYRDIVSRYKIREIREFKDLTVFLITNAGRQISYKTLSDITGLKSVSTIKNYIDFLEQAFLLFRLAPLHYSLKKITKSSYKIYAGEISFIQAAGFHMSDDMGQKLENLVYLHLLRTCPEVYFYSGVNECDFLIKTGSMVREAIQVSYTLSDPETREREIKGLVEAMERFHLPHGTILTFDEENQISYTDYSIQIVPLWKWLIKFEGY